MTEQNYNETDPNKYLMQSGEAIAQISNDGLKRAMTSDLVKMSSYCNEEEINKLNSLFNDTYKENGFNIHSAIEFDKASRLYAWQHWDNDKKEFSNDVLRKNINEWFEAAVKREQIKEQEKEDYIATKIIVENYEQIIHSKDFIEKFGDWEKAQRLEKAKAAPTIEKDGEIVIDGKSITEDIKQAREEKDIDQLKLLANKIGKSVRGTYQATDLNNENIQVVKNTANEIKTHDIFKDASVEAIEYIPDFINKGIFVSSEKNEDIITHADIDKYEYLLSGLNVSGEDYTVKSVIAVQKNGDKYYDQRLSKIEKGRLLSDLTKLHKLESLNNLPYNIEDKRLLRICQVSQRPYLDENLKPTQEAVKLVQEGKLYLEKDPVTGFTSMCNENECNHKILQFRNMFNAQQKSHEPKITYENAETILTNNTHSLDKFSMSKDLNGFIEYTEIDDIFDDEEKKLVHQELVENLSPREILDRCIYKIDNLENNNLPINEKLSNIKKLDEQHYHAENCSKIIENWIDACGVLGESKDFKNVTKHAKDSFRQNIENAKNNLSKLDDSFNKYEKKSAENLVSFNKDEFEYFKHNANTLFDNAVEKILVRDEINKQKELSQKAELDVWIEKAEKDNKRIQELTKTVEKQNQLLYGKNSVEINGKVRTVEHGLKNAFVKSVEKLDIQNETIRELDSQIYNLTNSKSRNISPKSPSDDGSHSY